MEGLRGKVVLIDFWTYSCINCIRTLPYLRTWYERYADEGLVIVGVHTPEFHFEKVYENVVQATKDDEVTWPVVQDNDFAVWRSYENRFWPAKYLVDQDGVVRYTHFGEGKYAETESEIRKLLEEVGAASAALSMPLPQGPGKRPHLPPRGQPDTYPGTVRRVAFRGPPLSSRARPLYRAGRCLQQPARPSSAIGGPGEN